MLRLALPKLGPDGEQLTRTVNEPGKQGRGAAHDEPLWQALGSPNTLRHTVHTQLRRVGVPYTQDQIDHARDDLFAQADPAADSADLLKRYPGVQARDFDGDPSRVTEMDALVAYLQMLGTLVDFDSYVPAENRR